MSKEKRGEKRMKEEDTLLKKLGKENSFKSFSLSANPLPVGIPAEGLGSGILQLGVECFSRTDLPPILRESFFLKDIFRLKHFTMHILQPECRWAGRLWSG